MVANSDDINDKRDWELYLFFWGGTDYVFYNALLQGQFRENRYEISRAAISSIVPHGSLGFVYGRNVTSRCGCGFRVSFSYNYKGEEITGGGSHGWSSISLGISY